MEASILYIYEEHNNIYTKKFSNSLFQTIKLKSCNEIPVNCKRLDFWNRHLLQRWFHRMWVDCPSCGTKRTCRNRRMRRTTCRWENIWNWYHLHEWMQSKSSLLRPQTYRSTPGGRIRLMILFERLLWIYMKSIQLILSKSVSIQKLTNKPILSL